MTSIDRAISSADGPHIDAHLAPGQGSAASPAVLLLHGFPSGSLTAAIVGADMTELADRIAIEMGWTALAIRFRGCGASSGQFSLRGWVEDTSRAIDHLVTASGQSEVWVIGFGTGGAVGLTAAVDDDRVAAVAVVGTPADFDDWARSPQRLLDHARKVGVISDPEHPEDRSAWEAELSAIRCVRAAELLAPRPLLVLHGSEDEAVPPLDARIIADAHGSAELRIISGAGHQLRHDPRGVAVLLGWMERTRNER